MYISGHGIGVEAKRMYIRNHGVGVVVSQSGCKFLGGDFQRCDSHKAGGQGDAGKRPAPDRRHSGDYTDFGAAHPKLRRNRGGTCGQDRGCRADHLPYGHSA